MMKSSESPRERPIQALQAQQSGQAGGSLEAQLRDGLLASMAGDREAYRLFLNRVAGIVTAYLMKSMNPSKRFVEKVEELTQDVLMSIHQKRSTYRPEMPVLPWIYAIARYRLIDSIRQESRRPHTVTWSEEHEQIAEDLLPDSVADIETLLAGLSEKQREVLVLAKLNDMPLAEVAKKMDMSLSAVKVTVHRAIRAIRKNQESHSDE
jgi:RNA polymerase sigma-70 factor (ECF subfamily)